MIEKGYENLTVQHLLDRAGVSRSTFYAHFRDLEELLTITVDSLCASMTKQWKASQVEDGVLRFSLPLFMNIDTHREFYKATMGRPSGAVVHRQMSAMLSEMVRAELGALSRPHRSKADFDATVQFVIGAFMSMTMWWMASKEPLSPEAMNRKFLAMATPGLDGAFAD